MPKTLLLADDSVTIQKVVGISLANEDIELVTVENGDDAVTKALEVRPDIVLADIVMPGKNGYEVCEAIKTDPNLAPTPVLLLTGTFEAFDAERARQVGADGHITKPFEAQALVDQVNQLLARSTPIGAEDPGQVTRPPTPATNPTAPTADVGAHGEGGDAFDFFDGRTEDAESSWPTAADAPGGVDLMADSVPSAMPGQADETMLLDPDQGSGDPAFDAAVEAAAFDAPGERRAYPEADDSGFDLESADLSMANTVPEVPVAPGSMSFSDPLDATPATAPITIETAPVTDPLLDFDPLGESASGTGDETVLDPAAVQSFDVSGGATLLEEADLTSETTRPSTEFDPGVAADTVILSDANVIVEDANPARVQDPADSDATAPASLEASVGAELSPALEQQLHSTLEKIAWEAFSDLSEQVVKQVLAKVETVAWEVVPQMAEAMVKEEIERMQDGGSEEDS